MTTAFFMSLMVTIANGAFVVDFGRGKNNYGANKWFEPDIPYRFGDNIHAGERTTIVEAMKLIENGTCVRFVEDVNEVMSFHIRIQASNSKICHGGVGRGHYSVLIGNRKCFSKTSYVVHELMHNLGFLHEHQRHDRDEHIRMAWENIKPQYHTYFEKYGAYGAKTMDTPFDVLSVMHYKPSCGFKLSSATIGDDPTVFTIRNKSIDASLVGQNTHLTETDRMTVNRIYCDA